jgi:hypothetical protein
MLRCVPKPHFVTRTPVVLEVFGQQLDAVTKATCASSKVYLGHLAIVRHCPVYNTAHAPAGVLDLSHHFVEKLELRFACLRFGCLCVYGCYIGPLAIYTHPKVQPAALHCSLGPATWAMLG